MYRFYNNRIKDPLKQKLLEMKEKILELQAFEKMKKISKRYSMSVISNLEGSLGSQSRYDNEMGNELENTM
jgi:hypothetical protein